MCYTCWKERGKPKNDTPEVRKTAELIGNLYERHLSGGRLHIATDDWNLNDDDLEFCGRLDPDAEPLDDLETACLVALKALSYEDRCAALAMQENMWGTGWALKEEDEEPQSLVW